MPRAFGVALTAGGVPAEVRAEYSLTRDRTAVDGNILDERRLARQRAHRVIATRPHD